MLMGEKRTKARGKAPVMALVGGAAVIGGGAFATAVVQHVPTVRPGVILAEKNLAGMTKDQAVKEVQAWFSAAGSQKLNLVSEYLTQQPGDVTPEDLGAKLDLDATLKQVPFEDFWSHYSRRLTGGSSASLKVEPVLVFDQKKIEELGDFIEENMKAGSPARAKWEGGRVKRTPEVPGMKLDLPKLSDAIFHASLSGEETEIPMVLAPKKIPDAELEKITEVISSYSTRFNNGQVDRSSNIRLAASVLDGRILLPGESFSFNRWVGRRTAAGGFKTAGVLVNGRKEYDIGGGICQVSTTLYNAAVFADMKITARSPHSRPVPYVPIGRDAAVSYPNPDLAFTNVLDTPIAISAEVGRGVIEFKILGQKEEQIEIKIVQGGVSTSDNGVKYVEDSSLGYGVEKVIESGSSRKNMTTYKITMRNGREVKRETLSSSFYRGTPRIIARNSKAKPATSPTEGSAVGSQGSGGSGSSSSPGEETPPDL